MRHLGAGGAVYPWPRKTWLLTSGIEKEAQIFWEMFLWVFHPWNGSEFHPPARHIQLVDSPIKPCFNILYKGLQKVVKPAPGIWVGQRPPEGCVFSCLWESSGSGSTSSSQKVTLLSCQGLLGDLSHLSREWLCGWILLQLQGQGHCTSLIPQLSLSMSLLSTYAASSTL